VVNGVSNLLYGQHWLRADAWDLALFHFIDCRNKSPNSRSKDGRSPWQVFTKEQLDFEVEKRFEFGDLVAVGLPGNLPSDGKAWKFDCKNEVGIYVGDPVGVKGGALVYWPYTHTVSERMHMWKLEMSDAQFLAFYGRKMEMLRPPLPYAQIAGAVFDFLRATSDSGSETPTRESPLPANYEAALVDDQEPGVHPRKVLPISDRVLRSARPTEEAAHYAETVNELLDSYGAFLFEHGAASVSKVTVRTALQSEEQALWVAAIRKEVFSLIEGGTLEATTGDIVGAYKLLHSTAQLKLKQHQDGTLDKYKARLCACGNELYGQVLETYSPTVGALAYAVVHQIAIIDRMQRCIVDVVQAYLYQEYPQDSLALYLVLPDNVSDTCGLQRGVRYRIKKYMYGLPDAGLAYYKAYSAHMLAGGYERTVSDPCLFSKLEEDLTRTYVWIHVDDTFVASTADRGLQNFQSWCRGKFDITVAANVEEYLGIKLTAQGNGDVVLTQPKLLGSLESEFKEQLAHHRRTNAPQRAAIDQSQDETPIAQHAYLHLLGALIYIVKSRPDIATAVSFGATHAACPTQGHFDELLHCLAYLLSTRDKGLRLRAGEPHRSLKLLCYVDASYLTHADSKSHTGYCLSFGELGCFYSKSSKQQLVTTSSTHAEMRALYSLTIDIVYLVNLCEELGRPIDLPAIVLVDNQPVIDLVQSAFVKSKRCKHFLMLVQWVRERVEHGYLELRKVATKDNVADILTKIITGGEFQTKAQLLLG
jgi:hypothetical protein